MESADSESLTLPPTGRVGDFRCAAAARARAESLAGTAPQVNGFLLLEEPGPWGIKAWRDARLPEGFGLELQQRCAAVNLKALLIRRGTGERGTGERGIVGERSTRERGTGERETGERGSVGERRISERGKPSALAIRFSRTRSQRRRDASGRRKSRSRFGIQSTNRSTFADSARWS